MTKFKNHFYFGTISKAHGLKGEMVVKNLMEDYDLLGDIEGLFLDVNNQLVPYFLRKISYRKKGEAILELEDINSIEATKQLEKKDIYLPESLLPEVDDSFIRYKDMIGFDVEDKKFGNLGKIRNVVPYPQQEIFEIEYNGREILIPANEDFIVEVDTENKLLKIDVPEGLIELYLTDKHSQEE
ncbi:MAG: 16S rRNA processing protein RimM [Bacteroidetes bacterium]|nr:16S rRNA processing protein RimM [Bacteroidota bacterium]